jgi:hypothetical protein
MNAEETKRAIKVMQAFVDGKPVLYRPRSLEAYKGDGWMVPTQPAWDWDVFDYKVDEPHEDTATMEGLADDVRCLRDMVESQERYLNKLKRFLNI